VIAFDEARSVADAVLYEGYLLYPYTASATKNHMRWQFGVVVPRAYAALGNGESASVFSELLLRDATPAARLSLRLRFLRVQQRSVERSGGDAFVPVDALRIGDDDYLSWDEAVAEEIPVEIDLPLASDTIVQFSLPEARTVEPIHDASGTLRGRIVRHRDEVYGNVTIASEPADGLRRIRVTVENDSSFAGRDRSSMLRKALVSTHVLIGVESGAFMSLIDPPDEASASLLPCENEHLWPVLLQHTEADAHSSPLVLCSPIILYDFPEVAAQSRGDMFDATEIDELLNLSVLSLSDREKREARATDPAARAIVDRAEQLAAGGLMSLHGTIRSFDDEQPSPGSGHVVVEGVPIERGSAVRLHPRRRADVWDMFVDGKDAHVQGVYEDMDGVAYIAVTVDDDPASELHEWYGRSLFFYCDEIEPLEART